MPTSIVDMLVTCDREVVEKEEEEIYDGEMKSDASFVTCRYFRMDNAELDGLTDSDDEW